MKIISIGLVLILSGCSFILPVSHDPVLFNNLIETKMAIQTLTCDDKYWDSSQIYVERLKLYAVARTDPQADTIIALQEAISKAKASDNKVFCESVLKIQKARIEVILNAWKFR